MRGADGGPWRRLCALPALLGRACSTTPRRSTPPGRCARAGAPRSATALRHDAGKLGLRAEIAGRPLLDVARDVLGIAEAGLRARARPGAGGLVADETHFLSALHEIVARGETASDELLARYRGEWDGDLSRIYGEYSY